MHKRVLIQREQYTGEITYKKISFSTWFTLLIENSKAFQQLGRTHFCQRNDWIFFLGIGGESLFKAKMCLLTPKFVSVTPHCSKEKTVFQEISTLGMLG